MQNITETAHTEPHETCNVRRRTNCAAPVFDGKNGSTMRKKDFVSGVLRSVLLLGDNGVVFKFTPNFREIIKQADDICRMDALYIKTGDEGTVIIKTGRQYCEKDRDGLITEADVRLIRIRKEQNSAIQYFDKNGYGFRVPISEIKEIIELHGGIADINGFSADDIARKSNNTAISAPG